jgi:hypothetical protein
MGGGGVWYEEYGIGLFLHNIIISAIDGCTSMDATHPSSFDDVPRLHHPSIGRRG